MGKRIVRLGLLFIFFLMGCVSSSFNRSPQADGSVTDAISEMTEILKNHVVPLDRDLIVFRYEHDFRPQTLRDVLDRETSWAKRFFDLSKVTGDDVGPGVFVAVDPTRQQHGV